MSTNLVERRRLLGLLPGALLSGCASFGSSSPFWGTVRAGMGGDATGAPAISRAYTDKLPYASMLSWFDGSPQALLVLGDVLPDGRLVWHSAERQTVTTFGAFVVAALGFERELRSTRLAGDWEPNPLRLVDRRLSKVLDLSIDDSRYQVALESRFAVRTDEDLEILDRPYRLTPVREECSYEGRVRFTNEYWVEAATGRCWKSRQTVIPTVPRLNIEILKYAAV